MNKRVIIYLGGILLLMIVVIVFIVIANGRSKTAQPASTQTNQTQTTGNTSTGTSGTASSGTNSVSLSGGTSGSSNTSTGSQGSTTTQTPASTSRIAKVSDQAAYGPAFSFDNQAIWYFTADGSLEKVNLSTGLKQEYLLSDKLPTIDAIWPASGNDFITSNPGPTSGSSTVGDGREYRYYSADSKQFTVYPPNIQGVDFSPDAKSIMYDYVKDLGPNGATAQNSPSGAESTPSILSSGNLTNTTFQHLVDMPAADLAVKSSSNPNLVLAYNQDQATDGKLYLVFISQKQVVTIKTSGSNAAIWSPDGKHFLYNRDPDGTKSNKDLWLGDSGAKVDQDLGIASTVSKAVFDSTGQNLYVAAASTDGSGDVIWKINLASMQKTSVLQTTAQDTPSLISISKLLISPDSTSLFFINSDGFLYGYKIGT